MKILYQKLYWQLVLVLFLIMDTYSQQNINKDFKSKQLKYPRVRAAYEEKYDFLRDTLLQCGVGDIAQEPMMLFLRLFKSEQEVEVWVKAQNQKRYRQVLVYPFCAFSGRLGPKRKQGDYQIPEGFYHISYFNPASNFHLSLKVSYPNQSDRILGKQGKLGGDIFIHGDCVTIGCVPITDDKMKILYILSLEAKAGGQQNIPIHIFPFRLTSKALVAIEENTPNYLTNFWRNLQKGYAFFEVNRHLPNVAVNKNTGLYVYK